MKEPGTSQNGDRFGTFVKRIRQKDPREITSIRLADYLGISPTKQTLSYGHGEGRQIL